MGELGVQFSNIIKVISNFYIIFYSTGNLNISPNAHIVLKIDDFSLITLITFVNYSWLKKLLSFHRKQTGQILFDSK